MGVLSTRVHCGTSKELFTRLLNIQISVEKMQPVRFRVISLVSDTGKIIRTFILTKQRPLLEFVVTLC